MSRKDTILIAVLVNAVLLIGLFISAIKNDVPSQKMELLQTPQTVSNAIALTPLKEENKIAQGDEIDQVLKEFTEKVQNSVMQDLAEKKPTASATEPSSVMVIAPQMSSEASEKTQLDFVKDLQALTKEKIESRENIESKIATAKTAEPGFIDVVVKRGDALEKIARNHQTTVEEIIKLNKLKNTQLQIGQVLKISSKGSKKNSEEKNISRASEEYYIVKNGDNLWTIALKNHIKVEDLLRLNNLNEEKAKQLKPNTKLRIR